MMDPDRERCCAPEDICRHAPGEHVTRGEAAEAGFIDTRTDPEASQLAFIKRRFRTVVAFSAQVQDEGYQVPDEDRATLARLADDLMFAVERAEVWRSLCEDARSRYEAEVKGHSYMVKPGTVAPPVAEVLRHFDYEHLPQHLRSVSMPFARMAYLLARDFAGMELVTALNLLVGAKDWAVRAAVVAATGGVPADGRAELIELTTDSGRQQMRFNAPEPEPCPCRETGPQCGSFDVDIETVTLSVISQRPVELTDHVRGRVTLELVNVGEPPFGDLRTVRVICGPHDDPARLVRAIIFANGGPG